MSAFKPHVARRSDRVWRAAVPGASYCVLRLHHDSRGATLVSRFLAGTRGGRHVHPGGEELYVLEGNCEVDGVYLTAGDYLHTPEGCDHELVALSDVMVLVVLPLLPIYGAVADASAAITESRTA